jgi:hypothetical protein
MTGPSTTPSLSLIFSIVPHARSYWARFFDRTRRPSLSSFVRTSASTFSPSVTISVRVDVVADAQLARRDDALALVADVEQHLVRVDLDDVPLTIWPSSTSTIVPSMASAKDMPRSSTRLSRGCSCPPRRTSPSQRSWRRCWSRYRTRSGLLSGVRTGGGTHWFQRNAGCYQRLRTTTARRLTARRQKVTRRCFRIIVRPVCNDEELG